MTRSNESQLPAKPRTGVAVRNEALGESVVLDGWEEDSAALPQVVRDVQETSQQPQSTFWRRVLFIWFRLYKYEAVRGKSSTLNLRIPIPLPLVGALFQQKLSWSQAFQFIEQSRRPEGIPPERFLESCMPLEFLRLYEGKNGKEELLVIGFD